MTRIEIEIKELEDGHIHLGSYVVEGVNDNAATDNERGATVIATKAIRKALTNCPEFATCEEVEA